MDNRTGEIMDEEEMNRRILAGLPADRFQRITPTVEQIKMKYVNVYDPCPCGSGKKFRFCCQKK